MVQPGVTFQQLLRICLKDNWILPVIPGTRFPTVGGATANNVEFVGNENHSPRLIEWSDCVINFGSSIGYFVMIIGLVMSSTNMVFLGALLFSAVLLFQIVTLPVEFNASSRAKSLVVEYGIISPEEQVGISRILNSAALTYVAAAVSTLLTLLYFLMRARR